MSTNKKKSTNKRKKNVRPTGRLKEFWMTQRCRRLRGACYILLSIFLLGATISFFVCRPNENWLGKVGYKLSAIIIQNTFGIASLGLYFLLFLYGLHLWKANPLPLRKTTWATLFWMVWLSSVLGYCAGIWGKGNYVVGNLCGVTGDFIASQLYTLIKWGALVLFAFVAIVFLIFVHKVRFKMPKVKLPKVELSPAINNVKATVEGLFERNNEEETEEEENTPAPDKNEDTQSSEPTNEKVTFSIDDEFSRINQRAQAPSQPTDIAFNINDNTPDAPDEEETPQYSEFENVHTETHYTINQLYDPHLDLKQYEMPSTDLLTDWETRNVKVTKEELVANKDRIVETLHNYGIEIVEITASPGPTVTLYEIKPAPGVRISKIKNLEDDIALSLSALGIRIIAPIPGKGTVGIEVPNAKPQIVSMKNMLECEAFRNCGKMELPIAFGKTISNDPYVADLAKMPHLLMAGATGTGKSVGLNAVIASLLYKKHPSELKFVMVDPKKVELSLYNKIERHYLAKLPDSDDAIITDVKKVVRTLNSLCIEMDQRYELLRQAGVRKITEYNDKFIHRHLNPENGHRYLPYIVLIIDEFADLIMTAGKEVELPICRLAQLARAVGIHLIIATQRPTTNIITGTIKANFPARIAFKVTSGIDSRTILDCSGAQRLIGRGDMLISLAGSDLVRIQCALIETEEIEELADFIGSQRGYPDGFLLPEYLDENEEPNKDFDPKQKDEFFNDAARLVVASQFGSTSLLQRKLQLGYNRAGRIIDQLEAAGIVGPYNGSKAREVLVHSDVELEEILRNL
ncbi:MAG: DNA translocase FtsK 4TM domain-containing protein [Bacteroidales bacterium]|nr:DNA translocase FtsK 4TM domain-containing protein [Bacteroidales bacterium]